MAALCKDPDRLGQVLAGIDDPAALATLVTDGPSSRVRQSAAAAIDDPTQLHDLLPRVRGKDKAVYKLIKQKCDALTAERSARRKKPPRGRRTCANRSSGTAHETHRRRLRSDPAVIDGAVARAGRATRTPQVEQRGEQALERCREVIAAHEREVAAAGLRASAPGKRPSSEAREAREREQQARQAGGRRAGRGRCKRAGRGGHGARSEDRARADHVPNSGPRKRRPSAKSAA